MSEIIEPKNLPAQIAGALVDIPHALVPECVKALNRLVAAGIDVPVAWLHQKKAQIDAQTESFKLVEASIAKGASSLAELDQGTVQRAAEVLIRKEYRKQVNREAVAAVMIEDLSNNSPQASGNEQSVEEVDEDWLNVFERFAEDASTERMQGLWGRVLAGEIRKPGRYGMRTLRFLSEFSQADALSFSEFSKSAFRDIAPNVLVKPQGIKDIRQLIYLESAGLIQGASGGGLQHSINFNEHGDGFIVEDNLALYFKGEPNSVIQNSCCALTPLGQELLSLLPGRNAKECARRVGHGIRTPGIKAAYLGTALPDGQFFVQEVLWQESAPEVKQPTQ